MSEERELSKQAWVRQESDKEKAPIKVKIHVNINKYASSSSDPGIRRSKPVAKSSTFNEHDIPSPKRTRLVSKLNTLNEHHILSPRRLNHVVRLGILDGNDILPLTRSVRFDNGNKSHSILNRRASLNNFRTKHEYYTYISPRLIPILSNMSQSTTSKKSAILHESHLKCPVCRNFYDSDSHLPLLLPCLHTCCSSCLKERVKIEMVQCPSCTEVHEIPNNDISKLARDYGRDHLVKCFKVQNRTTEIGCDGCDIRNRAISRCKECDQFLCGVCTEAHKRTKMTKSHNIASIDTLKRPDIPLEEFHHKETCKVPEHEDQPFSFYCCNKPICSLCAVNEHKESLGHKIRDINDVYLENKRKVEGVLIDIQHKKTTADETLTSIEDEIQNLYIKESSTEEEIDNAFLACQKQLEKRKNALKEKLVNTSKVKKKGLESHLDKLTAEKIQFEHALNFSKNLLSYCNATEFLQVKETIMARLTDLKEKTVEVRPQHKSDIKFQAGKMTNEFQNAVNNLGDVWTTTAYIPNTKIQTFDIGVGREETALVITLHDYENRPLAEPGVEIRVEVTDPKGKKSRAMVRDCTEREGCYKATFHGAKVGEHRTSVFILGTPIVDSNVTFKVRRPGAIEADVVKDYEGVQLKKSSSDPELRETLTKDGGRVKQYRVFGDIVCPDMVLDEGTVHPQCFLTSDGKSLKNTMGRGPVSALGLKNYRGVIATKAFSKSGRFYFEVIVHFFIKRQLRQDLIFEIGIARRNEIDKHYTADGSPYAWICCARRCPLCRTVCLQTWHNGQRLYHSPLTENAPPGTNLRTTIGFLLDMQTKQWFIVDAKNRRLFYRFRNVDTTKPLWPIFGAYNPDLVSVTLNIKTGRDIQAVPDIPEDA
ncbi:hypothetical protein CHS0354_001779 [Potamilus streckersoni]|uniref:Uncharacterized protein n=1 Tax=Potamilus streckersoni TaxID=2493646 RepID=A0AAE0T1F1_9BIVA|nr:hypothetical protein CHS0354_001779 [Potamilus streckersoni]